MLTDRDYELLDGYLDGALDVRQHAEVEARLGVDAVFAAELAQLRSDRQLRQRVWESMQADDAAADRVMEKVSASLARRDVFASRLRSLRLVGAAAACILVGFATGHFGKSRDATNAPGPVVAVSNPSTQATPLLVANNANPNDDKVNPDGLKFEPIKAPVYQVTLKDEQGRVVAVQRFNSVEKARAFADEVGKWQEKQNQVKNGHILTVGDEF